MQDRLKTNATGFFDTLPKLKLGTFNDATKRKSVLTKGKNVVLHADRNLFARLLVIGQSRKMDIKDLLTHELGLLPWSLAALDGTLAKTKKAILCSLVENSVKVPSNLQASTAVIFDAMALIQMLVRVPDKFCYLTTLVFDTISTQAENAARIDFVGDQYPPISMKNVERHKRGN